MTAAPGGPAPRERADSAERARAGGARAGGARAGGAGPGGARAEGPADPELTAAIAETVLGPVVHRWLLALEQYVAYFDDGATAFLYCARAGVRIRRLFDLHCAGRGIAPGGRHRLLWSSRLGLCKGLFDRAPERSAELIAAEYAHRPLRDLVGGLLRNAPDTLAALEPELSELDAPGHGFPDWIGQDSRPAAALRASLAASGAAFERMFAELTGGAPRVVLIDSGWRGSGQSLLARAHPDREVHGLYLGRILSEGHDPAIADRAIGLLFEAEAYDPARPETAVTLHRHLFESLLEPNGPSVEEVPGGPCDAAARAQIRANADAAPCPARDALFLQVEAYLKARAGALPAEIEAAAGAALPRLARMLVHPDPAEARVLAGKARSADFGRDLAVPVLVSGGDAGRDAPGADDADDADARIARALWPQGQAALEYDGGIRREIQRRLSGLSDGPAQVDPAAAAALAQPGPAGGAEQNAPLVSVITRTRNRPVLLRRAAASVAAQRHAALEWIVVNDGGDETAVRDVLTTCAVDRRRIRLVSHAESRGMEAASNAGIVQAGGRYVLIHDDDDTLHPDFLRRTVAFLESPAGRRYGGVVTGTDYVSEEIRGDRVIEHARVPYMDWVEHIQLAELLAQNLFAPIAFLYRRSVYDAIGGYCEELPVLGDWYFNLEFALRSDIAVLPERLAGYHHRDRGDSSRFGAYSNSVIGGQSKHVEFAAVMRNRFMRRHGRADPVAAGAIGAYFAGDLRHRLERIEARLDSQEAGPDAAAAAAPLAEIDRLWALSGLLSGAARAGAAAARAAAGIDLSAPLPEIAAALRGTGLPLAPHPSFDEGAYLARYPDVAEAVREGRFGSAYEHFVLHGQGEGRARPGR